MDCTGKQVTIRSKDGIKQMFNTFQIKLYYKDINFEENMHMFKSDNDTGPPPFSFHFREVIDPEDPRASKCEEAKQKGNRRLAKT